MKKYILIYVYNNISEEELLFWEQTNTVLEREGYNLFLLLSNTPGTNVKFRYAKFTEKLDDVVYPKRFNSRSDSIDYSGYLEREKVWYGESQKNRLAAAKFQRYKYSKLIKELNPSLLVLGNGNHAGDMILKGVATSNSVPVIYIERGALPNSWQIDEIGITAGTKIAKTSFNDLKVDDIKFYLNYKSYYLKTKTTWWKQPSGKCVNIKERYNIRRDQKLVLFANQLDNDTSNFLYNPFFSNNLDAFEWFCDSFARIGLKGFILIKKHPHYKGDSDVFQNKLAKYDLEGAWVDDITLFDCIEQADLICAVNSTMLFESLLYMKPVLQLGDSILNDKEVLYKLKTKTDYGTVQEWYNKDDFKQKIENYKVFISYLIKNELSFFFKEAESMGFNSADFFVKTLMKYPNELKKGTYPLEFIKINNYSPKKRSYFLRSISKKIFKKLNKLLK